jgi:hypothetical protein
VETGLYPLVFEGPEEALLSFSEVTGQGRAWERAWHAAESILRVHTYVLHAHTHTQRDIDAP